ncbi:hypothetical protein M5K25_010980 [Dendrobium thyrsiflorum]|uniref:Uncharacterized protein n=1 Tax=Dendrobium thyrsiflorum TaxID=117978 RepID=A0ABD0V204_DENTH
MPAQEGLAEPTQPVQHGSDLFLGSRLRLKIWRAVSSSRIEETCIVCCFPAFTKRFLGTIGGWNSESSAVLFSTGRSFRFKGGIMAGRKVEVLEGEIGQLKTNFDEKISDFQNQFIFILEKMDERFAALEEMMRKMLEDKQKSATLESKETTGGHGRGGNPNPFRGTENPEVEILEGNDGMPPLEPLSREEMSIGYDRRGANFVGRREEFHHRGANFKGRRGEYNEGFGYPNSHHDSTLTKRKGNGKGNRQTQHPKPDLGTAVQQEKFTETTAQKHGTAGNRGAKKQAPTDNTNPQQRKKDTGEVALAERRKRRGRGKQTATNHPQSANRRGEGRRPTAHKTAANQPQNSSQSATVQQPKRHQTAARIQSRQPRFSSQKTGKQTATNLPRQPIEKEKGEGHQPIAQEPKHHMEQQGKGEPKRPGNRPPKDSTKSQTASPDSANQQGIPRAAGQKTERAHKERGGNSWH